MKRTQLAQKLSLLSASKKPFEVSYLIGFDGFTDEILSCVKMRQDAENYEPIATIREFGERIVEAADKGTNFELVVKKTKIGGNGPILASALATYGFLPTLIGALGFPEIEPLFQPLLQSCKKVFSLTSSGHTDALEFTDSKIILGKMHSILQIDVDLLIKRIPEKELVLLFDEANIFVSANWTMILGMTKIWKYLISTILPQISVRAEQRQLFIDLADPAKRSDLDLQEAIITLADLSRFYTITLGLNELEAKRIAHLFNHTIPVQDLGLSREKIVSLAAFIQSKTGFETIVIHTTKYAAACTKDENIHVDGPFCKAPFLTTGGGDNFNAGFLFGRGLKLSLDECLLLAVATSGYYIRVGKSPTIADLISFLRSWDRDPLELELLKIEC